MTKMRKDSEARRASGDGTAEAALAKMGYKSELPRNLSIISVLGMYAEPPNHG